MVSTSSYSFLQYQSTNVDVATRRYQLKLGRLVLDLYRRALHLRSHTAEMKAIPLTTRTAVSIKLYAIDFDGIKFLDVVNNIERNLEAIMAGRVISVNDSFDRITKQHSVNDKQFKEDLLSILGLVLRCRTRSRRALRTMRTEQEKLNDSSTQEHLIKSPDSQYIDEQLQGISQDSGSLHRFIITLDTFKGSNGSVPCLSDALSFFTNTSPFNRKRSHSMMVKEEIG